MTRRQRLKQENWANLPIKRQLETGKEEPAMRYDGTPLSVEYKQSYWGGKTSG